MYDLPRRLPGQPQIDQTPTAPAPIVPPLGDENGDTLMANAPASTRNRLDNISPETVLTAWSSAPITDWPATLTSYTWREALLKLSKLCPKVNEDILLLALEEHDFVVNDAAELLTSVGTDDAVTSFLVKVFPGVPRQTIDKEVAKCYRRYMEVFSKMVMKYHSYWKPHPDPTTSALSLSPPTRYRPDFQADGNEEEKKESEWWRTLADTVRWQVTPPVLNNDTWTTVVSACHLTQKSYSPRLAGLVGSLAGPDSTQALDALKVLPAYSDMIDLASSASHWRDVCLSIVVVLTTQGIAAPGAVAWAFEQASANLAETFVLNNAVRTYSKTSSTVWLARNKAMFTFREKSFGEPVDPVLIDDEDIGKQDDSSAIEVPVSPTISQVTRTSVESKKKGKKILSPYPVSRPLDKKRASDDDVRAAQSTIERKRKLPDDIIELTSESEADMDDSRTEKRHASPDIARDNSTEPPTVTPQPVIMSPSPVSPRKVQKKKSASSKTAPTRKSLVKTRSTR